jgi:predicted nucleic-acid-binding Zn-ribbon protein
MPCEKCGSTNLFATTNVGDEIWSCCKDCGYSPEYPKGKVVGWDCNNGFAIFDDDSEEDKKHEDVVLWSEDKLSDEEYLQKHRGKRMGF